MTLGDWLNFFRRQRKSKILPFNYLALATEMNRPTLRMALKRLAERKVIQRICRGFYANPFNPPTLEEISVEIYKPSYVSLESALSRYGILSQIPQVLTCVTTRLPRRFKTPFGAIEYRQVARKYFFGFLRTDSYWISEPEKALADFLYLNRKREIQGFVSGLEVKGLNQKKLKSYTGKMGVSFQKVL